MKKIVYTCIILILIFLFSLTHDYCQLLKTRTRVNLKFIISHLFEKKLRIEEEFKGCIFDGGGSWPAWPGYGHRPTHISLHGERLDVEQR